MLNLMPRSIVALVWVSICASVAHAQSAAGLQALVQLIEPGVELVRVDGEEHLFLGAEVEIQRALGEAHLVGGVSHAQGIVGRDGEALLRHLEDVGAAGFLLGVGDGAVLGHGQGLN